MIRMQRSAVAWCQTTNLFMRASILLGIFAACGVLFLAPACKKAGHLRTYTYALYEPFHEERAVIYEEINGDPDKPIVNAGKIYVKDNYIYINEIDEGIHVIDNTDPAHPFQTAFIRIPGNRDIAVKYNILYADMYAELLSINISDIHHVSIVSSTKDVFTERGLSWYAGDTTGLVVGMKSRDTTVTEMVYPDAPVPNYETFALSAATARPSTGKAGSMARMVLFDDYIYAIGERHSVSVLNISENGSPKAVSTVNAGFDLETIFPFEDKLFLGSAIGMYMYDISDRENPKQLGTFSHGRACDPVIADGDYAYVTLRSGSSCGGDANELDVINIKDLMNPSLVRSYPMDGPKGLSKEGHLLFVCDGNKGVRVLDAKDPGNITTIAWIGCPDPYDVITGNNIAMVVAPKGIFQFDYTNPSNIKPISTLTMPIN